jgi:hypothetical protein
MKGVKEMKKNTNPKRVDAEQVAESFVPLYLKGVELVAELQKKSLEMAAEQSAEWFGAYKKVANQFVPAAQVNPVIDLAAQAFDTLLGTQKEAIDLFVEQSQTVTGFAQEGIRSANAITESATELFQKSLEYAVAAQKKALDVSAEQNKAAYETVKRQFGYSGTPSVQTFQKSLDALVETQKAVLDIASKPLKARAAKAA